MKKCFRYLCVLFCMKILFSSIVASGQTQLCDSIIVEYISNCLKKPFVLYLEQDSLVLNNSFNNYSTGRIKKGIYEHKMYFLKNVYVAKASSDRISNDSMNVINLYIGLLKRKKLDLLINLSQFHFVIYFNEIGNLQRIEYNRHTSSIELYPNKR